MIAALWSNSNYDDDKETRKQAIEEIEENFQAVSDLIMGRAEPEEEIDEENPFFGQMKKGMEKILQPRNDEGTVAQAVNNPDYQKYIDQ